MKQGLAFVLILVLAIPALAEEPTGEDLYHEAYVLEVIEGKVAEAAKRYLGLMNDEEVARDVRAESRLRFAICTVLLGRADEGRLQLTGLIADEATPEPTRERAEAYLASITEVGIGAEIDRKLESLVFDLARVDTDEDAPEVYRDFEVVGKRALAFLRQLLHHPDLGLSRHAFRLLVRMDEPGLGALWTPRIGIFNNTFYDEWARDYLGRRPDELRAWEATLLALSDADLKTALEDMRTYRYPFFSIEFMEEVVNERSLWELAIGYADKAGTEVERWAAYERWLGSDKAALAARTAQWILDTSEGGPTMEGAIRRWPRIFAYISKQSRSWAPNQYEALDQSRRFPAYLRRLPTDLLLDSLEQLVEASKSATRLDHNPLLNGLAGWFARTALARELDGEQIERVGKALRSWLEVWHGGRVRAGEEEELWLHALPTVHDPLARYLEVAAPKDAEAFIEWLLEGPGRANADWFADAIGDNTEAGIHRIRHALSVARPEGRVRLAAELPNVRHAGLAPKARIATLEALPEAIALVGTRNLGPLLLHVSIAAQGLPLGERTRLFRGLVEAEQARPDGDLPALLEQLFPLGAQLGWDHLPKQPNYLAETALPVLDEMWDDLTPATREAVMTLAWRVNSQMAPAWQGKPHLSWWEHLTPGNRARLISFLKEHIVETPMNYWGGLHQHRKKIPLELWLPQAPSAAIRATGPSTVPRPEADRVARLLVQDLENVNAAFLAFVLRNASREVQQEVFDQVLRASDPVTRRRGLYLLRHGGFPASFEALLDAREAILAEEAPALYEVGSLADRLMEKQPSEQIFPLVRLLLKGDRDHVGQAVRIARDLGRQELIEDLLPLLDSMDRSVRDGARVAIKAIREVAQMER